MYRYLAQLIAFLVVAAAFLFTVGHAAAQDGDDRKLVEGDEAQADQQQDPNVTTGSLVICGGGSFPQVVAKRFVELAGGRQGRLIVIPTAGSEVTDDDRTAMIGRWTERGIGHVSILHTRNRAEADSAEFIAPLDEGTAVWFGGGLQSRLADAYVGTETEQAIVELYRRGGVVGGSSAGAAIQTQVMIQSGNPVPVIAVGMELLPGAIVDQHFLRRNRFNRLLFAVRKHPQLTGVGIDEGTGIVYRQGKCTVLGESYVTVVSLKGNARRLTVETFHSGQSFPVGESK